MSMGFLTEVWTKCRDFHMKTRCKTWHCDLPSWGPDTQVATSSPLCLGSVQPGLANFKLLVDMSSRCTIWCFATSFASDSEKRVVFANKRARILRVSKRTWGNRAGASPRELSTSRRRHSLRYPSPSMQSFCLHPAQRKFEQACTCVAFARRLSSFRQACTSVAFVRPSSFRQACTHKRGLRQALTRLCK